MRASYCQSAALATVAETAQVYAHTSPYSCCHSSYGPTINSTLLTDHTNYARRVEIASGKGRA